MCTWLVVDISVSQQRALLTRDRRLLMHSVIETGYSPRSQFPEEQTIEVLRRFDLHDRFNPYWSGSHFAMLQARIERITARVQ